MNEKFYALPQEKQRKIINAGYRVFGEYSYRKSPVGEVAKEAGISKSLLFHYFRNKKEFYFFLWKEAIRTSEEFLEGWERAEGDPFFDILEGGIARKIRILEAYPKLSAFVMKAFYETDREVAGQIQEICSELLWKYNEIVLNALDSEEFIPGLDLQMMYRQMYWASDGYMREALLKGELAPGQVTEDFRQMVRFWKRVYLKDRPET